MAIREIIFRGKRIDNGEWVEGYLLRTKFYLDDSEHSLIFTDVVEFPRSEFSGANEVIPETVGQYTGMKDVNGKRIFEGDLVKPYDDEIDKAVIEYHNARFCICYYGIPGMQMEYGWDETAGEYGLCDTEELQYDENEEVIGNIHDNPELLEVEENA